VLEITPLHYSLLSAALFMIGVIGVLFMFIVIGVIGVVTVLAVFLVVRMIRMIAVLAMFVVFRKLQHPDPGRVDQRGDLGVVSGEAADRLPQPWREFLADPENHFCPRKSSRLGWPHGVMVG